MKHYPRLLGIAFVLMLIISGASLSAHVAGHMDCEQCQFCEYPTQSVHVVPESIAPLELIVNTCLSNTEIFEAHHLAGSANSYFQRAPPSNN